MTKNVRIENADMSDYKVLVFMEDQAPDGSWIRHEKPVRLDVPTTMVEKGIWAKRRIVIEEESR